MYRERNTETFKVNSDIIKNPTELILVFVIKNGKECRMEIINNDAGNCEFI